jgi:hypothetical protein
MIALMATIIIASAVASAILGALAGWAEFRKPKRRKK